MLKFTVLPIILMAVFVIVGVTWFSPQFRIKYFMKRGNYRKARQILEPLLAGNPDRLNYYRHLAEIYYFENRKDKKALKVYETIIKLNIPFQWKNEILPMVAKFYISQGRTDADAIELIEKAAQRELSRLRL